MTELGESWKRVDGPGVGCAGVGHDAERHPTSTAVRRHSALECRQVETEEAVARDPVELIVPEAEHTQPPVDARVGLIGTVDHCIAGHISKLDVPGDGQGCDVGHGATADKQPARRVGQATCLPQPVDGDQLDLSRAGGFQPGAREHIEA